MKLATPLALAALVSACSVDDDPDPNTPGGQFGEEDTGCQPASETELSLEEVSILGFAPADVLALAEAEHSATLDWSDGSSAALTLTVSDTGAYRYVDYEYVSSGGEDIDMGCEDTVEIDVIMDVITDDGVLGETFDATLVANGDLLVGALVELEDLSGSFDATETTTETYDSVWATLSVEFAASGVAGEITGYGESTSGSGPDSSVSLTNWSIASF